MGARVARGARGSHLRKDVGHRRVRREPHCEGGKEEPDVVGSASSLRSAPSVPERGSQPDPDTRAAVQGRDLRATRDGRRAR